MDLCGSFRARRSKRPRRADYLIVCCSLARGAASPRPCTEPWDQPVGSALGGFTCNNLGINFIEFFIPINTPVEGYMLIPVNFCVLKLVIFFIVYSIQSSLKEISLHLSQKVRYMANNVCGIFTVKVFTLANNICSTKSPSIF